MTFNISEINPSRVDHTREQAELQLIKLERIDAKS
jgi:hypothetical protein